MKLFTFITVLLLPLICFGQIKPNFERTTNNTIPEKYKVDISKLREHIYAGVPENLKKDKPEEELIIKRN